MIVAADPTGNARPLLGVCDLRLMGREVAVGLLGATPVFVWGVRYDGRAVYVSDQLNGLWKLAPVTP